MKKLFSVVLVLLFACNCFAASYWVNNPVDCPTADATNFPGQSCTPNDICGDNAGIAQCYDTSLMNPPVSNSAASTTNWSGSYDGGYLINCYATVDAAEPYCDNSAAGWCDRDSSCFNGNRTTQCNANKWSGDAGDITCLTCISGYTYCDGSYTDADGCEVQIGTTACDAGANNYFDASCICNCKTNYYDCDASGTGAGNGCEKQHGTACSVGALNGTWSCSTGSGGCYKVDGGTQYACTCTIPVSNLQTGVKAEYNSDENFLWGKNWSYKGNLLHLTSDWNRAIVVNAAGRLWLDANADANHLFSRYDVTVGRDLNVAGLDSNVFVLGLWKLFVNGVEITGNGGLDVNRHFESLIDLNTFYYRKADINANWYGIFDLNRNFHSLIDLNAFFYRKTDVNAGFYGKLDVNAHFVPFIGATKDVNLNFKDLNAKSISAAAFFGSGAGLTGITGTTNWADLNAHLVPYIGADFDVNLGGYGLRAFGDVNFNNIGMTGKFSGLSAIGDSNFVGVGASNLFASGIVGGSKFKSQDANSAYGINAVALGKKTTAFGNYSTALGIGTTASGTYSVALGYYSTASGTYSVALGDFTTASGPVSTALGQDTIASGPVSTALGYSTTASGLYSTALGAYTIASGDTSTALGYSTTASGPVSTALGYYTTASGISSTALGEGTTASELYSTALGAYTTASGISSTALGIFSKATGAYSTTMGWNSAASGTGSIAGGYSIGSPMSYYINATGDGSVAMGYADSSGTMNSSGTGSISMGYGTKAFGSGSVSLGYDTNANADYATAIGYRIFNNKTKSVALGPDVNVARDLNVMRDLNVLGETRIGGVANDGTGKVLCVKSNGYIGACSDAPNSSGVCTCA